MKVTLFVAHYENKLIVAARRWRLLISFLRKEGMHFYVVTPGLEDKEYIGEYGELVCVFKARSRTATDKSTYVMGESRKVLPSVFPYLDISLFRWLKATSDQRVINHCINSDMLISSYGPAGPMLFGLLMSGKYNKPWVLDIRDSFQIGHSVNIKLLSKFNGWVERKIVGRASLSITIGERLAHYLSHKYRCTFEYIYSGWTDTDPVYINQRAEKKSNYFLYAGSIHQHRLPAFKIFLDALAKDGNFKLRIRLIRDYSGNFIEWLRVNGFENTVDVYPPVSPEQLSSEMMNSIGVLIVEDINPLDWQKGTVTGKLFSLLVSGLPGIVISHQDVEVFKIAAKASGWFCAFDLESAQKAIKKITTLDKTELSDNKEIMNEYHCSFQAKKFASLCQKAIKNEL